ncbi:unnamed protein product, partial [Polarella glacialis]
WSAPALRPPVVAWGGEGLHAEAGGSEEQQAWKASVGDPARARSLPQIVVRSAPTSGPEAAAIACPCRSASELPLGAGLLWSLLSWLSLLSGLQACCQGQGPARGEGAPEVEVTSDGAVTYEWKSVVERQRSLNGGLHLEKAVSSRPDAFLFGESIDR